MAEQEHEEPALKVSDRRHFTGSGERRSDVDAGSFEETPAAKAPPAAKVPSPRPPEAPPPTAPPPPPARERLASREITFAGLVQDLYATAMLQLGAELQPGQRGQVDLEGARETIDLLGMLEQKTHGNLDARERQLLTMALDDLRLAYVEVKRAGNRVQPAVVAPPPPPPGRRR